MIIRRILAVTASLLIVGALFGCSSKDDIKNETEVTYNTDKISNENATTRVVDKTTDFNDETTTQKQTQKPTETTTQEQTQMPTEETTTFDFSEYDMHGKFHDGLAWVCVSDYTGTRYGYINESNEYVIPLSEEIKKCYDYKNGIAVVMYGRSYYEALVLYDIYGNQVDRINDGGANEPILKYFTNGNIYIGYPQSYNIASESYMYVSSANMLRPLDYNLLLDKCGDDYCNGYLYSGDCFSSIAAIGCAVYFYDEYGNVALELSSKAGEYYKNVYSATDFVDGKSKIIFMGQDRKRYTVEIDTNGNWLGEPERVGENYRVRE